MVIPDGQRTDLLTRDELKQQFNASDYAVVILTLAISIFIGFYFAYKGQKTNEEYLMADKSMGAWPIAFSLVVSFMSGASMLGYPAETYTYGTQFALILVSFPFQIYLATTFYLPVYYRLGIMTSYQYLGLRFQSDFLRIMAALSFTLQISLYTSLCIYVPSLVISEFTDVSLELSIILILLSCMIYTVLGGLKAVLWTDFFQGLIMICCFVPIVFYGTYRAGGPLEVLTRNYESGRLQLFNTELDPRYRTTMWSVLIGGTMNGLSVYGCNQVGVQFYQATSSLKVVQRAMWLQWAITTLTVGMFLWTGLLLGAFYYNCDPMSMHQVTKRDQLLPLFVLQIMGTVPCVPGLVVAGLCSAALSSVSGNLNAITSVVLTDMLKLLPCARFQQKLSAHEVLVSRLLNITFGLVSYGCVGIIATIPGVLQAALSIFGLVGGPLLGLFSMALFLPFTSARGAACGYIIGLALTSWIGFGQVAAFAYGTYGSTGEWAPQARVSVDECPPSYTRGQTTAPAMVGMKAPLTSDGTGTFSDDYTFTHLPLYDISYLWIATIGCSSTILIGTLVSLGLCPQDPALLDSALVNSDIPSLFKCCPRGVRERVEKYWATLGCGREEYRKIKNDDVTIGCLSAEELSE